MFFLIAGLVVFFGIHSVSFLAPGLRAAGRVKLGKGGWRGLYSATSAIGLALIIFGWMQYRSTAPQVFTPPAWGRHATELLVLLAFISLAASLAPAGYIRSKLRHPFNIGFSLWALGHLLANGDLAALLVFGAFLAYSVIDAIAAVWRGDSKPQFISVRGDLIAVGLGVVAYVVFGVWLHPLLFVLAPFG